MITIAGVGPGDKSLVTCEAKQLIENAQILVGAKRHLDAWNERNAKSFALDKSLLKAVEFIKENEESDIVVLASGEPTMYGIASYLRKHFEVKIINGISSVQYLFSKINVNMNDLYITSTHGKKVSFELVESLKKAALVTDSHINPQSIASELIKQGSSKKMIVGENLSYAKEKIYYFNALEEAAAHKEFGMNVTLVYEEDFV